MNAVTRTCRFALLLGLLLGAWHALLAAPAAGPGDEAERRRIRDDMQRLEEQQRQEQQACHARALVQRCMDEVQRRYQAPLDNLHHQGTVLDLARRQERGAARLERLRLKSSQSESQRSEAARQRAAEMSVRINAARQKAQGRTGVSEATVDVSPERPPHARPALASGRVQRYEAKKTHAEERQRRAEEKHRRKVAGGKQAQPLPVPESVPPH